MPTEVLRIEHTDFDLPTLQKLLQDVEADLFKNEGKRISVLTVADPSGPDAGHNVIGIDPTPVAPPLFTLQSFAADLEEGVLDQKLTALQTNQQLRVRCYGTVLVSNQKAIVALCDPAGAVPPAPVGGIQLQGKMSTFGGPDDTGMAYGENLAWIENEKQAAAYPGYFLPGAPGEGYGRRLNANSPDHFYLACRWNYDVTPKSFLALPTTLCTVTNPANGQWAQARPIDWGPSPSDPGAKDRVADLSPSLATALGLETDQICQVQIPTPGNPLTQTAPVQPPVGATSGRRVVMLTGDYVGHHARQAQAKAAGCHLSIEFHFNSNGSTSIGSDVFYKQGDTASRNAAQLLQGGFNQLFVNQQGWGGNALASNEDGGRSAFIDYYSNPAVLIEPLFVSNKQQADWIHDDANIARLAQTVAAALVAATQPGDLIGLSIGHLGKDSSPHDTGADCIDGDTEATHGEKLALAVRALLTA